jgi:exodeoxyribonuclease V gamma subunit
VLHLHRAERADGLVEALGDVMVVPSDDPMTAEVIAVPTHGVERWLSQRLSARLGAAAGRADGVCANVDFPFPGRLVGCAVAAASGIDRQEDPWLPERAVWPLLDVVDQCVGEPWLASLAAHLGAGGSTEEADLVRRGRRFSSIRHIADLYDSYGVHRPQMLRAWAVGVDTDGATGSLPSDAVWQAELWRRLRTRIAVPSLAERLGGACDRLAAEPDVVPLPARISLFGLTRLPASYLQVLVALAVARDVHLFLLHPSPVLWARVAAATGHRLPALRRADDHTTHLPRNPLVASWASDSREMQLVLGGVRGTAAGVVQDHYHRPSGTWAPSPTVLRRIQADVAEDRSPPGCPLPGQQDARPLLDPEDRSLQIHACHGLARQVEVVRDAILHALREDPTLEARDVIVMCPDIETFAPLVHATFGAGDPGASEEPTAAPAAADEETHTADAPPDLRVRLADRSLRQTNPVLGVVAELLHLASARLTASQVLDLAGREPVRRRFGFDDDALAQVQEWATATGIRWGLDAAGRAPFKLSALAENTWESGFDRVLLGVAMAEEQQRLFGGVLPLDDVGSGDIDLAGRFAEFIDRLHGALDGLRLLQTVEQWRRAIAGAADALTVTTGLDGWQREQLENLLDDVVTEATTNHTTSSPSLTLTEVRSLLTDRLRGQPTRANFRTGHLTVCTMVPMRSVPHRVVCLLGLDEGVFPRKAARDGDDLLLGDPHVGDRDSRSEDRQLLLDALMAATDRLIITYAARDERTNAERPPAVPVGELLDLVDRTVRTARTREGGDIPGGAAGWSGDGTREASGSAREAVVIRHPLQPFDPRNFTTDRLLPGEAWSFDVVALDGARALSGRRYDAHAFLAGPLPDVRTDPVELDQLVRFVQHPVKAFLRQRLGVSLGDFAKDVDDALPVQLDKLEQWGVGQRLLDGRLRGADLERCMAAEKARGILPPNAFAEPVLDEIRPVVEDLVAAAQPGNIGGIGGEDDWGSVDIHLPLLDGRILVGTVPEVSGNLLREVTYSRVGPKHRLAAWVRFLSLTAAYPDRGYHAATVGRVRADGRNARITTAFLLAFEGDNETCRKLALVHLQDLIDLYDRGLRQPLPLYCQTSASYAYARKAGKNPETAAKLARSTWETSWGFEKEDKDLEHLLVLGGPLGLDAILQVPPDGDETGDGWAADESTRFGRYARRLWDGLLACEQLVDA